MDPFPDGKEVFNNPKEVGVLNHHGADIFFEEIKQDLLIRTAFVLLIGDWNDLLLIGVNVGLNDSSIFGMDCLRDKNFLLFDNPLRH